MFARIVKSHAPLPDSADLPQGAFSGQRFQAKPRGKTEVICLIGLLVTVDSGGSVTWRG